LSSRSEAGRYLLGQVPLHDYFDSEEDLAEALSGVRFRVVSAFLSSVHPESGKATGLGNYIVGVDERISSLATHVLRQPRTSLHRAFGYSDLPEVCRQLPRREQTRIVGYVHHQMVMLILVTMRDECNLWRFDGDWCFSHLLRVEHDHVMKAAKLAWRDQRNWHGRPSKQGRRRAHQLRTAPGMSISAS